MDDFLIISNKKAIAKGYVCKAFERIIAVSKAIYVIILSP